MIARLTVAPAITFDVAKEAGEEVARKARLSMAWSLDPTTGKLVARWVAAPTETSSRHSLASAA